MDNEYDLDEVIEKLSNYLDEDHSVPKIETLTSYRMDKKRIVYLDSPEIDFNAVKIHKEIMKWNLEDRDVPVDERKPIWLLIFCYGGIADVMWSIIDTIEMSTTPVYTVNIGVSDSAASLIFMSGKKRFVFPNGHVTIHEGSASMSGDSIKVLDASDSYRKTIQMMRDFILGHSKITKQLLTKKRSNDWQLSADECLEHGVCDVIVHSLDEIGGN